jgi:hypothetical protein
MGSFSVTSLTDTTFLVSALIRRDGKICGVSQRVFDAETGKLNSYNQEGE